MPHPITARPEYSTGALGVLFGIYATIASGKHEQTGVLVAVAVAFGIGAFIVRVFSGIIFDRAIDNSDEPKRAAACLKVIEDRYADPETRAALRASAEGGANAAGTRSLLPIALLTIIASIGALAFQASSVWSWLVLA